MSQFRYVQLPQGMDTMPPGPELYAAVTSLSTEDRARLRGLDLDVLARAEQRLLNALTMGQYETCVEIGLRIDAPEDTPGGEHVPPKRLETPGEFSSDELRPVLVLTRRAAERKYWAAYDLTTRHPLVVEAMRAGLIDEPRAVIFADLLCDLSDAQIQVIESRVVPEAPGLTTGELTDRLRREAIAIDPDYFDRRYKERVKTRKVIKRANPEGTVNLGGYDLPLDEACTAKANLDRLAKKAKAAGDDRSLDAIRADLFLGFLSGVYRHLEDSEIIHDLLTRPTPHSHSPSEGSRAGGRGSHGGGSVGPRRVMRPGYEVRVRLSTLLGRDDLPGDAPGTGPVHAPEVRRVVAAQVRCEWRFAIVDESGRLITEGITSARPTGWRDNAQPRPGGIVEIAVPGRLLEKLAAGPAQTSAWAPVIADLNRRFQEYQETEQQAAAHHQTRSQEDPAGATRDGSQDEPAGATRDGRARDERRLPKIGLRRHTQIRDRRCAAPGCRASSAACQADHIVRHTDGGGTTAENLEALCPHDHRLKDDAGWRVSRTEDGTTHWTSRHGPTYSVRPPPILYDLPGPRVTRPWPAPRSG